MNIRFAKLASQVAIAAAITAYAGLANAADTIKIGVSGPFTGGSSSMGVSMRDGVKLAVDEINKAGGVIGRQIQIIERDDEAKNERGVQIAQELINKEKVTATVGFINTGVALASQRFYQEAKIPVMNNVATGSIVTHQFDDQPVELLLGTQQGGYGHGQRRHGAHRGFFFFNLHQVDQVKANHAVNQSHVGNAVCVNGLHCYLSRYYKNDTFVKFMFITNLCEIPN